MAAVSQWWLYMIETVSGKYYTGITTDVERRFAEHIAVNVENNAKGKNNKGAKFFRSDPAKKVVYREACSNRSEASQREAAVKKLSRAKKRQLVDSFNH